MFDQTMDFLRQVLALQTFVILRRKNAQDLIGDHRSFPGGIMMNVLRVRDPADHDRAMGFESNLETPGVEFVQKAVFASRPFGGQSDRSLVFDDVVDALKNAFEPLDRIVSINRDETGFVHPLPGDEETFDLLLPERDHPFLPMGEIAKVVKARKMIADEKITGFCRDFLFSFDLDFDVGEQKDDPENVLDDPIAPTLGFFDWLVEINEERSEIAIHQKEGEEGKPIAHKKQERDEKGPELAPPPCEIVGQPAEDRAQGQKKEKENHNDYHFPPSGEENHALYFNGRVCRPKPRGL